VLEWIGSLSLRSPTWKDLAMKKLMCVLALGLAAMAGAAHAADAAATCDAQAADKKLHGAAKTSFTKKCVADAAAAAPAASSAQATCDTKAAEKKLHGAAKTSFTKKCVADAGK
jgi:hypothetical protein